MLAHDGTFRVGTFSGTIDVLRQVARRLEFPTLLTHGDFAAGQRTLDNWPVIGAFL